MFVFFKQKTAYEMRISDWSSDVCSSDLDLFMKRVFDDGPWTLFSPSDVPDLHDLTGRAFEERYEYYEELTKYGKIKLFKKIGRASCRERVCRSRWSPYH